MSQRSPVHNGSAGSTLAQIFGNQRKLIQRRLQILYNLCGDHIRGGKIGGVLEAVVLEPEDVEAGFVALDPVVVGEGMEALGFLALVAILCAVAGDEIVRVLAAQWVRLQREVLVGAEVVDPQLLGRGFSLATRRSKKSTFAFTPCA